MRSHGSQRSPKTRARSRHSAKSESFRAESELQQYLAEWNWIAFLGRRAVRLRREMPIGGCIPDLVVVGFGATPPERLWPRRWTYRHAHVVATLRRRSLRLKTLAARCFDSPERLQPVVTDLLLNGTLRESKTGVLALSKRIRGLKAEVVAVEAKLERWSDALEQARSYRGFSNRVIVAMDAERAPRSKRVLRRFAQAGIGLWRVSARGIEVLLQPRPRRVATSEWEYVVASAVASRNQTLWMRL
jgi:hypothetical protein